MKIKPFSLLIKPASADCNQDCAYCFYLSRSKLYSREHRRMSAKLLKRLVSSYMRTQQPHYVFTWQGGEPTLMGVDFFKQAVKLQQKYGEPGAIVSNGLQTNAVLINDEFAQLFSRYNFLPYTISGEEWGNSLCEIFDEWIKSDIYTVSIRLFDALPAQLAGKDTVGYNEI